jgi:hypothetical protein
VTAISAVWSLSSLNVLVFHPTKMATEDSHSYLVGLLPKRQLEKISKFLESVIALVS